VQLEQLADNKTFVGTTDTYKKLEIDLESLETRELIKWQDDNYCMTGVSHSKRLPNGTVFSICSHFDIHRMALSLMVFRMDGDNTLKRKMIANIPQDRTSMQHAFAMTHEYAIIFDPPYYIDFDTYGMMFQNKQLLDLIENDLHGTTKIHVVRLSDG
jgi:carotenoid cleavage dioxygenase-like enzyme